MQMNLLFPDICDLELGEICGKLAEANSFATLLTGGNRAPITLCLCLLRFTGRWAAAEVPMHAAASSTDCSVSNLHPLRRITKNVTAALFKHQLISVLDCKEIQPVHPKGDQAWVFIGRTDVKAETPILWPPHVKSWLIGKDPDAWRDWGQEEKGMTEDEMAGWHHRLDGHEFEWTPGVGDGQGGLACCNSWGRRESDTTERLNWTELNFFFNVTVQQAYGILVPWPGVQLATPALEGWRVTTGPPGKSPKESFLRTLECHPT